MHLNNVLYSWFQLCIIDIFLMAYDQDTLRLWNQTATVSGISQRKCLCQQQTLAFSHEKSKESLFPLPVVYSYAHHFHGCGNTGMVFKFLSLAVSLKFCIIKKYTSIYLLFYYLLCLLCQLKWTLEILLTHGKISVQKTRGHEMKSFISST